MKLKALLCWSILLGVVLVAYWQATEDDFLVLDELEHTYARKKQLLTRLEELPERERLIKTRLADLGGQAASNKLYDGEANTIQALIQRDVRSIATDSGVHIARMRPLHFVLSNTILQRHTVQISFTATHEKMLEFMDDLSRFEPMLRPQKVSVRVQKSSSVSEAAQLAILLDISGFSSESKLGGLVE